MPLDDNLPNPPVRPGRAQGSPTQTPPTRIPHRHEVTSTEESAGKRPFAHRAASVIMPALAFVLGAAGLFFIDYANPDETAEFTSPRVQLTPAQSTPSPDTSQLAVVPQQNSDVGAAKGEPYADAAEILNPSIVQIRNEAGVGSGVIYTDTGLIVTNAHVVGEDTTVSVRVSDGRRVNGTVIGIAAPADIAVVQLDEDLGMPPASLAVGEPLRVGQIVVAMGSPYGFEQSVSAGIVSAVNRPVPSPTGHLVPMIQTDASINPGNSGGALADRNGSVIGLNSSIRTDSGGGSVGIGFAIPIDIAVGIAERLVNGEPFTPGFLGASGVDAVSPVAGVLVTEVRPAGPAEEAGIAEGDIIVGFGSKRIQTAGQLGAKVLVTPPGSAMTLAIIREGTQQNLDVVVGAGRIPEVEADAPPAEEPLSETE